MYDPAVKRLSFEYTFASRQVSTPGTWPSRVPDQATGRYGRRGEDAEHRSREADDAAARRRDRVGHQPSRSLIVESVMQLSARNQIPARVTTINSGEAIANVELSANGVRLVASITVEAVRELGLAEGSSVTAVIKASDVILATGD